LLPAVAMLGPAALYLGAVFVMGSVPVRGGTVSVSDKVLHLVVFGVMVLPLLRALRFFLPRLPFRERLGWAAIGATAAGAWLEIWQFILPHRSAEWLDLAADAAGAVLVAALAWVVAAVVSREGRESHG
jgi:VanZ family protein